MNIDKRWLMLAAVAVGATAGAAMAATTLRRHRRSAEVLDHKSDLKSWENEGGNLTPMPVAPTFPNPN